MIRDGGPSHSTGLAGLSAAPPPPCGIRVPTTSAAPRGITAGLQALKTSRVAGLSRSPGWGDSGSLVVSSTVVTARPVYQHSEIRGQQREKKNILFPAGADHDDDGNLWGSWQRRSDRLAGHGEPLSAGLNDAGYGR
eukprot:768455-Hanusia_phi.AAC.4